MPTRPLPRYGTAPTARELDMLWLRAQGATNDSVGHKLNVTGDTVKAHLRRLFAKIGAVSTPHAIALCYQQALGPFQVRTGMASMCRQCPLEPIARIAQEHLNRGTGLLRHLEES